MTSATEKLAELPAEIRSVICGLASDRASDNEEYEGFIEQYIHDFKESLATLEKRAFDEGFKAAMDYYGIIPS